jgi:hypothetical protein
MTSSIDPWSLEPMTSMFLFTGGAVGVLLVSFVYAEVRDATRGRRQR